MPLNLVTPPASRILTTAAAKAHLRVSSSSEDTYIDSLVLAAEQYIEGKTGITGRALITQTWDYFLDDFPDWGDREINFPLSPVASITSIKYYDIDDVQQTISPANYVLDRYSSPSRIQPAYGTSWPSVYPKPNAVEIRAVCGYGSSASDVPAGIVHAAKLIVGHLWANREETTDKALSALPLGVRALLAPYTIKRF